MVGLACSVKVAGRSSTGFQEEKRGRDTEAGKLACL